METVHQSYLILFLLTFFTAVGRVVDHLGRLLPHDRPHFPLRPHAASRSGLLRRQLERFQHLGRFLLVQRHDVDGRVVEGEPHVGHGGCCGQQRHGRHERQL